jgi:Flp pilus assembly protein TadD
VSTRLRLGTSGLALAIALVTVVSFMPGLWAGFVEWDDDYNFLSNPHYRGLGLPQLSWMTFSAWSGHWIPLTWLTLSVDWTLWGMNPFGYHLTSLLLHAVNAAVFFFVAARLLARARPDASAAGIRAGATVAALVFAIHPLRAESVVWITERRDVLSGLFYLLTVLTYLRAVDGEPERRRSWLALSVTTFTLAMLSKAIVLSLPFVLLVLDVYPLRRFPTRWQQVTVSRVRSVLLEKVPYVVVAGVGGLLAMRVATEFKAVAEYPLWVRPGLFGYNVIFYLWKTVVPYGLSPLYEVPAHWDPRDPRLVLGLLGLIVGTIGLLVGRRRWPAGLAVWSAYVVTLAPVGGLAVHAGPQIAADRYTYLACFGVALLAGGAVALVHRAPWLGQPLRRLVAGGLVAALIGLGAMSWQQSEVWHDSVSLWKHAIAVDPSCARCQRGLGASQHTAGASAAAVDPLRRAITLRPDLPEFQADLGLILLWIERPAEAVPLLERATLAFPENLSLRAHLGLALVQISRFEDGRRTLESVLQRRPQHLDALTAMGFALAESGRAAEARPYFERAVAQAPRAPNAHYGLARVHLTLGDHPAAQRELDWLRAFDPRLAERAQRR